MSGVMGARDRAPRAELTELMKMSGNAIQFMVERRRWAYRSWRNACVWGVWGV